MRILQIHHRYSRKVPSGEDAVVESEAAVLRDAGHEVTQLTREWDDSAWTGLGLFKVAAQTVWNPAAARRVEAVCTDVKPDLIHVHNTFPSFSPAVFAAAQRHAPTVFTVHNYRALCSAAVVTRDERPCFECLEKKSVLPALRYGCYRGSHLSTLPPALMIALHRGTWARNVDAFIALSSYQRTRLVEAGWPPDRVHVKPNWCADRGPPLPWHERTPTVVFAGRLSPEKGLRFLVDAWHRWGPAAPQLEIIGTGPGQDALARQIAQGPAADRIRLLGRLEHARLQEHIARARLLVMSSIWPETFGLVLAEAYAAGTPVAASRIGAPADMVEDGVTGFHFRPGDAEDLQRVVAAAWANERLGEIGAAARRYFEQRLTVQPVLAQLLDIYRAAIERRSGSGAP